MTKMILSTMILLASSLAMAGNKTADYQISVQNLTKGQPITPAVVVAHNAGFKLFKLGEEASEGLQAQAKDGMTDMLVAEINANSNVSAVATGSGVTLPGQKSVLNIKASPKSFLSISTMLARTNDAIAAGRFLRLPVRQGTSVAYLLSVYDAGAENNTESCEHIPAPPCGNPGQGPEGEGFVHAHPGVYGMGDLEILRDTFGTSVVKVVITRK